MPDAYLCDLLIHYRPSRTLRSSDKELLVQARCHLKTYGERAFSFIAQNCGIQNYGVLATTIEGQNAFASSIHFA